MSVRPLIDPYGRRIRKLRVSLLDACNFRCFYCMPEKMNFMSPKLLMAPQEIEEICEALIKRGLQQVRITGGEPTIRQEFRDIVTRLSGLPLAKLGMTTNGYKLISELDFLKDTNCQHINISLDSLNSEKFKKITRRDAFKPVFNAILHCKEMGFVTKINTVLMRGINDNEIENFLDFSAQYDIEIRFLEVMKIGEACGNQDQLFISADEAIQRISLRDDLIFEPVEADSTSFNFSTSKGARVGFIASESKPFCGSCSRWRLSADGFLRACLMSNKGEQIRGVESGQLDALLDSVLKMKPTGRIKSVLENMNQIGG